MAGPAYPPHFQHLTTLSPSSSSYYHPPLPTLPLELHSGPACHCGRSRHIILSRYISHTSFLALPPTNINLQAYSTSPPRYRPGLPLWLVSPFPLHILSLPSISPLSTHLFFSYRNLARLIIVVGPAHPNPSHLFLHRTLWPSQILPITP